MDANSGVLYRSFSLLAHFLKLFMIALSILTCVFLINQIHFSKLFPITTVRIYGAVHLSEAEAKETILPLVQRGFFSLNVEKIREQLLHAPWVANLAVRRLWPGQVEVVITEKKPLAIWNDEALLSDAGDLFVPKQSVRFNHLPKLIGPEGEQVRMLTFFNEMNRIFIPIHAKISYLELTQFKTWKVTLDNGIIMQMGHKDVLTRLSHFVKVYPKIIGSRAADLESVDLRYPNGVAVRWKAPIKT